MSLKKTKTINHVKTFFKEKGLKCAATYCFDFVLKYNTLLLHHYPKLILTKTQYKTFKLARKHFNENYKNIIAISPMFFIKNLKKHIAWIESSEFHKQYGHMLPLEMKQLLMQGYDNNSNMVTPPPPCKQYRINRIQHNV